MILLILGLWGYEGDKERSKEGGKADDPLALRSTGRGGGARPAIR